jgi:hypothetical protein
VSVWVANETGEQDAERVEEMVVQESAVEAHEEAAEQFLAVSALVAALTGVGLVRGRVGGGARLLGTLCAPGLLGLGWRVGHLGGELVYRHGAAAAYTATIRGTTLPDAARNERDREGAERE